MYLDNRGTLARSRAYNVRRREPRYVSSIPVTLQRFLRFGPVVTRGVTPRYQRARNVGAGLWRAAGGRNGCDRIAACKTFPSRCWRPSATAATPSLDLSFTLCLRLPSREFRIGYKN